LVVYGYMSECKLSTVQSDILIEVWYNSNIFCNAFCFFEKPNDNAFQDKNCRREVAVMKKSVAVLLLVMLMICAAACDKEQSPSKLVDLEKYSAMKPDGTLSIEVVYDYTEEEFYTYDFVINDQETIRTIMTQVYDIELKDYPEDRDIDFYQRWITVNQDDNEYYINLAYTTDGNDNRYLCQSQTVCETIEKYIEDNLLK